MEHSHKAVIKGNIFRNIYHFGNKPYEYGLRFIEKNIYNTTQLIREEVIWEGELDMPILKHNECIYIQELQTTVMIKGCLRTTENKYIYSTSHVIQTIEDEITEKSKEKALGLEKDYTEYIKSQVPPKEVEIESNEEKHKPWYKRLFGK